jgi:CheY-like chemotaxis protein
MTDAPRTLKILIVEDEAIIAMLMEDMVAELGHSVAATTGRIDEATKLAQKADFDFAVLDLSLDGVRTYSIAEMLAARNVPFVFATGYGSAGLDPEWKQRMTLQKPFQSHDLARVIRALARA